MSWSEIKSKLNSYIDKPLNEQINSNPLVPLDRLIEMEYPKTYIRKSVSGNTSNIDLPTDGTILLNVTGKGVVRYLKFYLNNSTSTFPSNAYILLSVEIDGNTFDRVLLGNVTPTEFSSVEYTLCSPSEQRNSSNNYYGYEDKLSSASIYPVDTPTNSTIQREVPKGRSTVFIYNGLYFTSDFKVKVIGTNIRTVYLKQLLYHIDLYE